MSNENLTSADRSLIVSITILCLVCTIGAGITGYHSGYEAGVRDERQRQQKPPAKVGEVIEEGTRHIGRGGARGVVEGIKQGLKGKTHDDE